MTELDAVLKPYTSHKKVRAAEITSVGERRTAGDFDPVRAVTLAGRVTIDLPEAMFTRYVPVPGDFFVVYDDGYRSVSPRKAFVEGHTADGESFADIKKGIKNAKANPDQA